MLPSLHERDLHLRRALKDEELEEVDNVGHLVGRVRVAKHGIEALNEAPDELGVRVKGREDAELVPDEELEDLLRLGALLEEPTCPSDQPLDMR